MKIRNMAYSFVVFYGLIILITTAWNGFEEGYQIEEQDLENGKNVFERLSDLNLMSGVNNLQEGIHRVTKPQSGFDLLGGLAVSASGTLQAIGGIITFPFDIIGVITGFYGNLFPPIVGTLIGFFAVVAVGFILLSAKLGFEL